MWIRGEIRPTVGSEWSFTANRYLRMIARKNTGVEMPTSDATRLEWSSHVPYRFAAMNPSGIPSKTATNIDDTASSALEGQRARKSRVSLRLAGVWDPHLPFGV